MGTTDNFDTPAFSGTLKAADTFPIMNTASGGTLRGATATIGQLQAMGGVAAGGATKTLTAADAGSTTKLDTAAGTVVTLPAATGTGNRFRFLVTVLATSNSHIVKVANATDFFIGLINGSRIDSGNAVLGFAAANSGTVATNSDTVTLNRTTTGSVTVGEWLEVEDVATATFRINGMLSATGAAFATPFTAGV
jgi:hypothetical protein